MFFWSLIGASMLRFCGELFFVNPPGGTEPAKSPLRKMIDHLDEGVAHTACGGMLGLHVLRVSPIVASAVTWLKALRLPCQMCGAGGSAGWKHLFFRVHHTNGPQTHTAWLFFNDKSLLA